VDTILITGITGFVGKNIKNYLSQTYNIDALSVRYIPTQSFKFNANAIIHLAGKAHDLKKVSKPKEYYESNFELTKQLFDAFLISEVETFVFMSTVKSVTDSTTEVLTEQTVQNPKTHYGISKRQAEDYILSKELPIGKRVYILRPCMIHGPDNKGNLNLLYNFIQKGLPWPLGAFENQRSFLSIENLCFVIKELLENKSISNGVYQVADDYPLSTKELISLLSINLNKKSRIWKINPHFIKYLAKLGDWTNLQLNTERLEKLTENYIVSNEKIIQSIGKSLPVSTKQGLTKTFLSFTNNK
jgi:nucleoside-diphosphate-sugar epimerase